MTYNELQSRLQDLIKETDFLRTKTFIEREEARKQYRQADEECESGEPSIEKENKVRDLRNKYWDKDDEFDALDDCIYLLREALDKLEIE